MNKTAASYLLNDGKMMLQLFVSGMSPKSMRAIENLEHFCEKYLKDAFHLEIIDIYKNPERAAEQHVVFSPSLVKRLPLPKKVLIGTLADTDKVLKALGIFIK